MGRGLGRGRCKPRKHVSFLFFFLGNMFLQTFESVNLGEKVQKKVLHYFLLITVTVKRAVVLWSDINLKK